MSKKGKPTIYNLGLAKNGQVDQINEISITSLFLKDSYTFYCWWNFRGQYGSEK